jgi:multidrug efflux pump subunit AcrA (membrane-fusion protein)
MTTAISFESLLIATVTGLERREVLSGSPIIVLEGPSLTGKSSFLHCLLYPLGLGKPGELSRAIRQNVERVETGLALGESRFRFVRRLQQRTNQIEVFDAHGGERVEVLDVTERAGTAPSTFLFAHMGLTDLLEGVTVRSGTGARPPAFADILPFLYADQASVASDIHGHRAHDTERRLFFELFMGLLDSDVQRAESDLASLKATISARKKELRALEAFVDVTVKSFDDIVTELDTAKAEEQEAVLEIARLKALMPPAPIPAPPPITPGPAKKPNDGPQAAFCPHCAADLRERDVADDCCPLCLEPHRTEPGHPPTVGRPTGHPRPPHDQRTLQALLDARQALGDARARIQYYTELLKPHQRLDQLRATITRQREEAAQAKADLEQLRKLAERNTARLEVLNEMFVEFVALVDPPHFEAVAGLDPETYLPSIAGDTTKQMAPGLLETANVVFRAALLRYALLEGHTYFPSTLILDSPQGQRGAAKDDRDYARRLYSIFTTLLETRGDLPGFAGAAMETPKFQLIVVDNGIPPNIRGIKRITLSYDDPLIPGVEYEPRGEDENALNSSKLDQPRTP